MILVQETVIYELIIDGGWLKRFPCHLLVNCRNDARVLSLRMVERHVSRQQSAPLRTAYSLSTVEHRKLQQIEASCLAEQEHEEQNDTPKQIRKTLSNHFLRRNVSFISIEAYRIQLRTEYYVPLCTSPDTHTYTSNITHKWFSELVNSSYFELVSATPASNCYIVRACFKCNHNICHPVECRWWRLREICIDLR